jgi:hypothetical protein
MCQTVTLLGSGTGADPYRTSTPLSKCLTYKNTFPTAANGVYLIRPVSTDIKVYCDMTAGGYTYEGFGMGRYNTSYAGWTLIGGGDFTGSAQFRAAFEFHYNTLTGLTNLQPGFTSSNCCIINSSGTNFYAFAGSNHMYPAYSNNTMYCSPSGGYTDPLMRLFLVQNSETRSSFTQAELANVQYYSSCTVNGNPGLFVKRYL